MVLLREFPWFCILLLYQRVCTGRGVVKKLVFCVCVCRFLHGVPLSCPVDCTLARVSLCLKPVSSTLHIAVYVVLYTL